ncbi:MULTISPECIES: hypothetical protein [Paenibacillus]|uniref:Zinc ribbon domain-containing protein n=2 Tax=Paenibacillus TaxID=44249 RepID=A0ABU3R842_9BACL|nr:MULTISPECIES: hypothetical protein [Paenibacillus]MCY9662195.1 hypothetical protein [Paenibacillus anseongense]MDU0200443.1 hypothetical protein [Paenibacillus sp. PFR10]MEB4795708.1 hypothetical protein [Paenibacillus chondroitinus]MEC0265760.1 hypothetical protein [Paenibacillus anseongense]
MSFFDKVKQGATDAAKKAQQTVELTKLKAQVSSKEKEIEKFYNLIGESVYAAYMSGDIARAGEIVERFSLGIDAVKQEIAVLDQKIIELRNEKECVCGKVVVADTKFCSSCGHQF